MKLISLYRSILSYAGIKVDENGFAYTQYGESKKPVLIQNKRLALPTKENLRNFQPDEMVIFHPLSENIAQGESEIINKLKYSINIRLNYTFGILAQSLLNIVHNVDGHKRLNPDQTDLLIDLQTVDQTSMVNFTKIMLKVIDQNPDSGFINIYLKRGGRVHDKKYSRAGIVSFNLYRELKENPDTLYGIKLRQKDKDLLVKLYHYIFPKIEQSQGYDYGSDSSVAPFLDSLMKASLNIAGRFNDIIELFEKEIDSASDLVFDSDWVPNFDNLDSLIPEIRKIPMQHAGETQIVTAAAQDKTAQLQTPAAPVMAAPAQQTPVYQNPSAPVAAPSQEVVKTKDGKIDFNANMHRNPYVAAAPSPFNAPAFMPVNPALANNRVPSWAMPQAPMYGQPMPQAPMYGQPMMQQAPMYGQPMPQAPMYGQPMPQAPMYGQPMPQAPMYGQPMPQAPMYGQPMPQATMMGQNPYQNPLAAQQAFFNQPAAVNK